MSKDWEKEGDRFFGNILHPDDLRSLKLFMASELHKQRKQLLQEVREKVISERMGNILGVCLGCNAIRSGEGSEESHKLGCLNMGIEAILKKLAELEKEVK